MAVCRRHVTVTARVRRRARLWAFGYADLAALFGMKEGAVRQAVCDGRFDPSSLESVLAFAAWRRAGHRRRRPQKGTASG